MNSLNLNLFYQFSLKFILPDEGKIQHQVFSICVHRCSSVVVLIICVHSWLKKNLCSSVVDPYQKKAKLPVLYSAIIEQKRELQMSDEITCSECGRPNLPEAEKCWYCQTPLRTHEENPDTETSEDLDVSAEMQEAGAMHAGENPDEDIPEWLKRIRELKKADQPEQEEEDQWRQQILFDSGQNEPSKKKPRAATPRPAAKSDPDKSSPQAAMEDEPPQNEEVQPLPDPILDQKEEDDDPQAIDPGDDELPDGFTPLDTKKG